MKDPLDDEIASGADPLDAEIAPPTPKTFMGAVGGAAKNIITAPVSVGKQFLSELSAIYKNTMQAKDLELRSLFDPSIVGPAAIATAKDIARPLAESAPEMIGGTMGGIVGGPPGAIAGSTIARGLTSMAAGKSAPETTEDILTTLGLSSGSAALPVAARYVKGIPGRNFSLPSERHATAASMMDRVPERFGVTDADVSALYANAERLSTQSPVARASLPTFTKAIDRMAGQASKNPFPSMMKGDTFATAMNELKTDLSSGPTVNAGQLNSVLQKINRNIEGSVGTERGAWKQALGALHDDLTLASSTGDPAFAAYADAIKAARMNFLRKDLEEVIKLSGYGEQRTGVTSDLKQGGMIAAPGKVQRFIRTDPNWAANVERAQPGLLSQIQKDIEAVIPVSDVVGRSIPGQKYGSGRLALGGSMGYLLSKKLGMDPQAATAVGAVLGGISPGMGITMSPGYIERSFAPTNRQLSTTGAISGPAATRVSQPQSLEELLQGGRP